MCHWYVRLLWQSARTLYCGLGAQDSTREQSGARPPSGICGPEPASQQLLDLSRSARPIPAQMWSLTSRVVIGFQETCCPCCPGSALSKASSSSSRDAPGALPWYATPTLPVLPIRST